MRQKPANNTRGNGFDTVKALGLAFPDARGVHDSLTIACSEAYRFRGSPGHWRRAAGRRGDDNVGRADVEGARKDVRLHGRPQVRRAEHAGGAHGLRAARRAHRGRAHDLLPEGALRRLPVCARATLARPSRRFTGSRSERVSIRERDGLKAKGSSPLIARTDAPTKRHQLMGSQSRPM
jgi:hypothetical protein